MSYSPRRFAFLVATLTLASMVGCSRTPLATPVSSQRDDIDDASPPRLPEPVLQVPVPGDPPKRVGNVNMSDAKPDVISDLANRFADAGDFARAAQCQHWLVRKTGDGRYDLACWESLAGNIPAAIYWLQEGGRL